MLRAFVRAAPLLIAVSAASPAQPATSASTTELTPVPSPNPGEGTKPSDALRMALGALNAGRAKEAQDALERAETRMLDRSVGLGQTNSPSDDPTVGQISRALHALAARDRINCLLYIQAAIGSATAQGL